VSTAVATAATAATATRGAPKLAVDRVSKRYGSVTALHETSLQLHQGEFLTLLGPSGSGKTTLLMMVAGLVEPDSGTILIDGREATYAPPFKRDIGMVFQNYALFPHLSIFENIAFPLRMRRRPEALVKSEVARVLELVQLPHVADRLPRQLSGGQQQRIALARCIVYRPSIILMDEPLGALDKKLRDQLQIEIKHLHRQIGSTILYVTHDQQETLTMSDRVCLMNHGRVEQLGTPHDLYFRPQTVFAADFLGDSNILPASVAGADGEAMLAIRLPGFEGALRAPRRPGIGNSVRVMIRPESLRLAQQPEPGWNALPAVVTEMIFAGGVTRYIMKVPGGQQMVLADLTMETSMSVELGREVTVQWRPESTILLPGDEGSAA